MRTVRIVYWRELDGMWLGHPEAHPEYMTQGETLDELKENLRDIIKDVDDQLIPMARTHEDMVLP